MEQALIVRGRYVAHTFIPDEPMPDAESSAELLIIPALPKTSRSLADAFGGAPKLRSGESILAETKALRDKWGDR